MKNMLQEFDEMESRLLHGSNRALHRFLAEFEREIISAEGSSWIQFTRPKWRKQFYLPSGHIQPSSPWFACAPSMMEFYRFFDGLRESPPPEGGVFYRISETPRVEADFRPDWFPAFMVYRESPIVFHAANGDRLVHTPDGTFVWCDLEEHQMPICAASFDELIAKWIAHHAVGDGHPFDSYGRD